MTHGGKRKGAGRKAGWSKYGEPTKAIYVPTSLIDKVKKLREEWIKQMINKKGE